MMSSRIKKLMATIATATFVVAAFFLYANIHFWLPAQGWTKHRATVTPISKGVCHTQRGHRGGGSTQCFSTVKVETNEITQEMSWVAFEKHTGPFEAAVWQYGDAKELRRDPEPSVAAKATRVILLSTIFISIALWFMTLYQMGRRHTSTKKK